MNKTLTLLALAALALTVTPTASACQYYGPAAETVNYATCGGGAVHDAQSVVEFVLEEAGRVVAFVIDLVNGIPPPI